MINQNYVQQLVGKPIYAVTRDGRVVVGKLEKVNGNQIVLSSIDVDKAKVSAFFPGFGLDGFGASPFITSLVLFDLLAIGTAPFLW